MMRELERFWKLPEEYHHFLEADEAHFAQYLYESYQPSGLGRTTSVFYAVKPLVPRFLQLHVRRRRARTAGRIFPAWPIEPRLEDIRRNAVRTLGCQDIPFIWFWPGRHRWAAVLTHDVEGREGFRRIEAICRIEEERGLRSSWNFVGEKYRTPPSLIAELKARGHEVGVHGLAHDHSLMSSHEQFHEQAIRAREIAREWGAVGFRSPSLLRNPAWLAELPFEYDSSIPDTDPHGPQPGGCLSIFPFFVGPVVELPVTMPQDHTLIEILRVRDISLWKRKSDWIVRRNGLVLVIVHPDYWGRTAEYCYRALLDYMPAHRGGWWSLARDCAAWWRQRDASQIIPGDRGAPMLHGPAARTGRIARLGEAFGDASCT